MSQLDELKNTPRVVADTGDIESIKKVCTPGCDHQPLAGAEGRCKLPQYQPLIADAIGKARRQGGSAETQLINACDQVAVDIGSEVLRHVPGRISTEVDARFCLGSRDVRREGAQAPSSYMKKMALVPSGF